VIGVDPIYSEICNVPLEVGGRWLDEADEAQQLPVIVLGWQARRELFGNEPCIGETIKIAIEDFGRPVTPPKKSATRSTTSKRRARSGDDPSVEGPYTREYKVIGAIEDVELSSDTYVSNRGVGFVTYRAYERISSRGAGFLVMTPTTPERREDAIREVREVLSDRYGLPIDDESTVLPYFDAISRGEEVDGIFKGIQWFLGAVALLILLLGAAGVANVVMISVTARTAEFGLRRALGSRREWIFAQVFLEAGLVCVASGFAGFLVGLAGVQIVTQLPLPEGFAAPVADLGAATIPGMLLLAVTFGAAGWPAWRAIRKAPIDALHGGL
jgi:ABC-type antimicrobial peptide transport system permease subunit